jgi:NADPH2:quinone reductase
MENTQHTSSQDSPQMKALLYRKTSNIENFSIVQETIDKPLIASTEVLVKVKAVAINPGETQMRRFLDPQSNSFIVMGYEFSGNVEDVGKQVTDFEVGDSVFGIGSPLKTAAYAEYIAVDYRSIQKFHKDISFTEAAALPTSTLTAWQAIFRQNNQLPSDSNTVLILGAAGGVGSMAVQLLKARTTATVIATASRIESSTWLKQLGADLIIDHHKDIKNQLETAGIKQVDHIFAVNGLSKALEWIPQVIKPYGYLSVVEQDAIDLLKLQSKSVTIFLETVFTNMLFDYQRETQSLILEEMAELLKSGKIKTTLTKTLNGLNVENLKTAHALLETGSVIGKIVIEL